MAADTVTVSDNTTPPAILLEPAGELNCRTDSLPLSAIISPANALLVWTASNGGVIALGDSTAAPVVTAAGIYLLTVTNPSNGCTATARTP